MRTKQSSNYSNSQRVSSNNSAPIFSRRKCVGGSGCGGGGDDDKDKKEQKKTPRPAPPVTPEYRALIRKKQKKARKLGFPKAVKNHIIGSKNDSLPLYIADEKTDEKNDTNPYVKQLPKIKKKYRYDEINWLPGQPSSHPTYGSLVQHDTQHQKRKHEPSGLERKQFELFEFPSTIKTTSNATKPVSSRLPKNAQNEQETNTRTPLLIPGVSYAQAVAKGVTPPLNTTERDGTMVTGALPAVLLPSNTKVVKEDLSCVIDSTKAFDLGSINQDPHTAPEEGNVAIPVVSENELIHFPENERDNDPPVQVNPEAIPEALNILQPVLIDNEHGNDVVQHDAPLAEVNVAVLGAIVQAVNVLVEPAPAPALVHFLENGRDNDAVQHNTLLAEVNVAVLGEIVQAVNVLVEPAPALIHFLENERDNDPPIQVNLIQNDALPQEVNVAMPLEGEIVQAFNVVVGPPLVYFPDIQPDNEQQEDAYIQPVNILLANEHQYVYQARLVHQLHLEDMAQNDVGGVQPVEGGNLDLVAYTQSEIGKYC